MSWSISVPPVDARDFADEVHKIQAAYNESVVAGFTDDWRGPTRKQIDEAVNAAIQVVQSTAVGTRVRASLSGHADAKPGPSTQVTIAVTAVVDGS